MKSIKLNVKYLFVLLVGASFFTACGVREPDEPTDPTSILQLSKSSLELTAGTSESITIENGTGDYKLNSTDRAIVTAEVEGNTLTVYAIVEGEGTITVEDKTTKVQASVHVTILKADTPSETPLSEYVDFTLGRPAHDGYPTSSHGITWDKNNADGVTAHFKGKFIMLTKTEFEAVNTKEALNDLHINGDEKSEFTAKSDANF
ncbi:MAG: hypothetical protein LBH80_07175, partial [Prevotellaceae bacterium]|nr:hypothetical protein [Prevotellaceae bacterium]